MMTQTFCDDCGAQTDSTAPCWNCGYMQNAPASQLLNNRYIVVNVLGSGGMGTVYQAMDTLLSNKFVAIKKVAVQSGITQELTLLAGLDHPNIPAITDTFSDGSSYYLVMKYIAGSNLAHTRVSTLENALNIGITLCNVLEYLHNQTPPIIFRDLKPENVIITPEGKLYLVDFGIARTYKPGQRRDTQAVGSPGYAPPEQYNRAQTDARSDIYALGALLYFLLTQDDPSEHPFVFDISLLSNIYLRKAVEMATQLDITKRYACISLLRDALKEAQARISQPLMPAPVAVALPVVTRSATAPIAGRSIFWIYSEKDERIVKELETHLAIARKRYGLSFLRRSDVVPGSVTRKALVEFVEQSFLVGIIHSNNLWADDALVELWDNLIYPAAKSRSKIVVPIIGRTVYGDLSEFFEELAVPRSRKALDKLGDEGYAEVASEIRVLADRLFK